MVFDDSKLLLSRLFAAVKLDPELREIAQNQAGLRFWRRMGRREAEILHSIEKGKNSAVQLLSRERGARAVMGPRSE